MKAIPPAELLSVSLQEISAATQEFRDTYFRELLSKYNGKVEDIPLGEISQQSPVILHRMFERKIGWYLVLATIDPKTKRLGTYGKKYFMEDEFKKEKTNGSTSEATH